jgi:hypothetical protein
MSKEVKEEIDDNRQRAYVGIIDVVNSARCPTISVASRNKDSGYSKALLAELHDNTVRSYLQHADYWVRDSKDGTMATLHLAKNLRRARKKTRRTTDCRILSERERASAATESRCQ